MCMGEGGGVTFECENRKAVVFIVVVVNSIIQKRIPFFSSQLRTVHEIISQNHV